MKKSIKYIFAALFLLIASFFVFNNKAYAQADTEITYGSEYVFNMASTSAISLDNLSSSKAIVVYKDGGGSLNQGTAIITNISDTAITFSSEYVFNSASTDYISVKMLSENKAVVVYKDSGNNNYGTAIIANISNNTITYGSEYVFNTSLTDNVSIVVLSENKFVIAYQDSEGGFEQGKAIIGEINGNTITFGLEYVFNTASIDYVSAATLLENKFVLAYQDIAGGNQGTAIIGTVSDKNISFSSEYVFNPTATNYISVDSLSENKIIIAYQDYGGNQYGTAVIADISDNVISFGSEYVFNTAITGITFTKALPQSKFIVSYQDKASNLNYGTAVIGTIPEPEPEPEPVPVEPEPEPELITIIDGDLIRNPNAEDLTKFDIYIVKLINNKKFKRLILSPHVFESYQHLNWGDVKDVGEETIDTYTTSNLVRANNDTKVYKLTPDGDTGIKQWLNITAEEFISQGYDSESIYEINATDRDAYALGTEI